MSIVVPFHPQRRVPTQADRCTTLATLFAEHRRAADDVFWLKENAEFLNILETTGLPVTDATLSVHRDFLAKAPDRLSFFPQYYRFFLSIALDLEDLGLPGDSGARMVEFAARQGLAQAELSDLQRAEARRLMQRRGVDPIRDPGLDDRLRHFACRSATFTLPNKKAAYELTHIAFYLSEYGRRDPDLPDLARRSLHYAGLTAFLEQNADLLAEVALALTWAGESVPAAWTEWLGMETAGFAAEPVAEPVRADDYHEFLVCNWYAAARGDAAFRTLVTAEPTVIHARPRAAPLGEISRAIYALDGARCGDWGVMRDRMQDSLAPETQTLLDLAAQSSPHFDAYFEGFARAGGA